MRAAVNAVALWSAALALPSRTACSAATDESTPPLIATTTDPSVRAGGAPASVVVVAGVVMVSEAGLPGRPGRRKGGEARGPAARRWEGVEDRFHLDAGWRQAAGGAAAALASGAFGTPVEGLWRVGCTARVLEEDRVGVVRAATL